MKFLLTILLSFVIEFSFAQDWLTFPMTGVTRFKFNYDTTNKQSNQYQYFKKGDSLIAIPDALGNIFYEIFLNNSRAFKEIYSTGYFVTRGELDKHSLGFDKKAFDVVGYKTLVVFFYSEVIRNSETETVFKLYNTHWMGFEGNPFEAEVHFKKYPNDKGEIMLQYLFAVKGMCQI